MAGAVTVPVVAGAGNGAGVVVTGRVVLIAVFVVVVSRPNIVKSPMTNANATRPPITQPI